LDSGKIGKGDRITRARAWADFHAQALVKTCRFAILVELYVEPTFAFFYYFGVAVMGLLNFLSYVVTFLAGM